MKKWMYTFLLIGVLTLTACASGNQASGTFDYGAYAAKSVQYLTAEGSPK